jgi:hypothetical protein
MYNVNTKTVITNIIITIIKINIITNFDVRKYE